MTDFIIDRTTLGVRNRGASRSRNSRVNGTTVVWALSDIDDGADRIFNAALAFTRKGDAERVAKWLNANGGVEAFRNTDPELAYLKATGDADLKLV